MDYSSLNVSLWNPIVQIGMIAAALMVANILRRRVGFIRRSLMPTAVLAGFLLLALKLLNVLPLDLGFMESLTYHGIAIGFIAMSLRVPERTEENAKGSLVGLKSGAIIASSYMIQGIVGLAITIVLGYTVMPDLFKSAGILLPMGYGQGPGQANNIGSSYEALGFMGGRSFGLALAAAGYLCACVAGIIYIAYLVKKGKIEKKDYQEFVDNVSVDTFQHENEVPISESLDRFSIQAALVLIVYLATYLLTWGVTSLLSRFAPGLAGMLNSLLWGFNFIIGSALATLTRTIMKKMRDERIIHRQYQNNYLLDRLSNFAFDIMIVTGIASIEIEELSGLWLPFILMAVAGGIVTMIHLQKVCRKVYPGYYYAGLMSMYGMMTGTISSGVLLLREIDPEMKTPAGNNLVLGSSFAILLAAPLLLLVSLAPKSDIMTLVVLAIVVVYYLVLLGIIRLKKKDKE